MTVSERMLKAVFEALDRYGPTTADRLADIMGRAPSTIRESLYRLEKDGKVIHESKRRSRITIRGNIKFYGSPFHEWKVVR